MKKLLILSAVIPTITAPTILTVSCSSKYSSYPDLNNYIPTREDKIVASQFSNWIKRDTDKKASNDNISVYFMKRAAAYIGVQSLLSAMNVLDKNENKEVYFYISKGIPDDSTLGIDNIDYISIDNKVDNFHFAKTKNSKKYLKKEDMKYLFNKYPDKHFDIYLEDYQLFDALNGNTTITEEMGPYWSRIDSINFTTDGTAHYNFEKQTQMWLEQQSEDYITELTAYWELILDGKFSLVNKKYYGDLDKILPTLLINNSHNNNFVSSLGTTAQVYEDSLYLPHSWNENGPGLESAYNDLSTEYKEHFDDLYKINDIDTSDYIGKDNLVFTGNLISENPSILKNQATEIVNLHNQYPDWNILFKPHPRENTKYYSRLTNAISNQLQPEDNIDDWFSFVKKEIPIEIFPLTKVFETVELTGTSYHYSITGSSTTTPAFYEIGVSDEIIQYVFTSQNQIEYLKLIYGNDSQIIDWDDPNKIVIQ